jgi:myo-inositol-1(or 4)-monophosphatase
MSFLSQRVERSEFAPLVRAAVEAAEVAAAYIRSRAHDVADLDWREKRQADFVSEVDTEAEQRIRSLLQTRVPDAAVLGEELSPEHDPARGTVFIVDPLDGTTNFLHGYPQYAVSIGAQVDGELVAGVVRHVARGECFVAARGCGAYLGGEPISVSTTSEPSRALVGTGFPFKQLENLDQYLAQFARVTRGTSGIRRAGSAALDLADVAAGRFDAFWELVLAPWDVAAGIVVVREAGGVVTDLEGRPATARHTPVLASNGTLHEWLLRILNDAGAAPSD